MICAEMPSRKDPRRNDIMNKQNTRKKGNIITLLIALVLIAILAYSGYNLYVGFQQYWTDYLNSLKTSKDAGRNEKTVNWKKLQGKNNEIIGWLYCKGTKIDYPVAQGSDNSKYLSIGADGKSWAGSGTLFVDCNNPNPLKESNTIIYGHHMRDGSMFHDLDYWQKTNYFKKHSVFYYYTPDQNYKLSVVAVENVSCDDISIYGVPFQTKEESSEFVNKVLSNTVQKNNSVKCSATDKFVTLSTCAYNFEGARSIIVCKVDPIPDSIKSIESDKPNPDSKWTVFKKMVSDIIKEGIKDLNGENKIEE